MEITFDAQGYPTEESLEAIAKIECNTTLKRKQILDEVFDAWNLSYGTAKRIDKRYGPNNFTCKYTFTTGGWSGNECLITAIKENFSLWVRVWVESSRGGKVKLVVENKTGDQYV